jgi:glycosyltransferase involved in cell wall biosynthesis
MIIDFFQPPLAQRVGGLDLATKSLKSFLATSGIKVRDDPSIETIGNSETLEIVHFHGLWQRNFPSISAECRRRKIPYVVSPHGMLEPWAWRHKWWKKWAYFYLFEYRHLSRARRLLTTSTTEARHLQEFFPRSNTMALPFGLADVHEPDYAAARRTLGWKEPEIIILFLSRIHPKKGLHLLLRALTSLGNNPSLQRARLVIVGGGSASYVRKLKAFVGKERERLPRVDWMGEIWGDAKWTYLQGADLMCMPSYSENFGFAVLESLQVGTRVITTNQTPWDSIPVWEAGWIVEPTVDSLEIALARYLANPKWSGEQRSRLATETHARYSWENVGPAYLEFYVGALRTPLPATSQHHF